MWFLLAHGALAQDVPDFNVQLFRPSVDSGSMLWTDDATRARNKQLTGRALLSYTADPLLYTFSDGEQVAVISDIVQADLLGAYTLGRLRVGADLPVYLFADGSAGSETGLGDLSADARLSILNQPDAPLGLALATRIGLPTASVETALGSAGATWEASAIVDKRIERLILALNLGTRGLPEAQLEDIVWSDQFFFRGGGAFELSEQLGVSLEVAGNLTYGAVSDIQGRPMEALLGGWFRPGNQDLVI